MIITKYRAKALVGAPLETKTITNEGMPPQTACVNDELHRQKVSVVELIQYGMYEDQHILIVFCPICNDVEMFVYYLRACAREAGFIRGS